jgi:hypothetical protein
MVIISPSSRNAAPRASRFAERKGGAGRKGNPRNFRAFGIGRQHAYDLISTRARCCASLASWRLPCRDERRKTVRIFGRFRKREGLPLFMGKLSGRGCSALPDDHTLGAARQQLL